MAAHVRTVAIPEADRRELQRRARSKGAPARVVERARIVLLAGEGVPGKQIAARVGCAEPTVVTWRRRYAEAGLAGLEAVSSAVEMLDRESKFSLIDISTQMQTVSEEWHRMRLLAPLATGDKARDVVDQLNKILGSIANKEQHAPDREAMLRKRLELRQRERRDIQGRWYYRS